MTDHDYTTECVDIIRHKVSVLTPRSNKEIYKQKFVQIVLIQIQHWLQLQKLIVVNGKYNTSMSIHK